MSLKNAMAKVTIAANDCLGYTDVQDSVQNYENRILPYYHRGEPVSNTERNALK